MASNPRTVVDCAALRHNLAEVRRRAPDSKILAVIKANAYGHGLVTVARTLNDADAFAVARVSEAEVLRDAGVAKPIVVLSGVLDHDELATAGRRGCELVIHRSGQIDLLDGWSGPPFTVWLKVETGMNRLGVALEEADAALERLQRREAVSEVRLMTHLASAEDREAATTPEQLDVFNNWAADKGLPRSIANSAAGMAWPDSLTEWIRPGLMLYGVSPFAQKIGTDLGLRPAMRVVSTLIAVKKIPAGARVGYGGTWHATRTTRLGIAAAGYGDGYPWSLPSGTPVRMGNTEVPLIGRISMDMIAVDLGDAPEAGVGDEVTLWGAPGLPVERIARKAKTIPYELLCGITRRVTAELVEGSRVDESS